MLQSSGISFLQIHSLYLHDPFLNTFFSALRVFQALS